MVKRMKAKAPLVSSLPEIADIVKDLIKDRELDEFRTYGGSYTQCDEASGMVLDKLKKKGVEATTLFVTSPSHVPYEIKDPENENRRISPYLWHMVVLVKGKYVLDFTARQYNPKVPFPVAWELKAKTRPVESPWDLARWVRRGNRHRYQGRRPILREGCDQW